MPIARPSKPKRGIPNAIPSTNSLEVSLLLAKRQKRGPSARVWIGANLICLVGFFSTPGARCGTEPVLFYPRFGHDLGGCFGSAAAGGRDLDGDGLMDFIVSEPNNCPGGTYISGSVFAYSGLTGNALYRVSSTAAADNYDEFGAAIAFVDDLDGDGVEDLAVGAPGSGSNSGSFYVYSGASGLLLYRRDGGVGNAPTGALGFSIAGLHDIDGDGRGDLLVGAPLAPNSSGKLSGAVALYSGATGQVLRTIDGADSSDAFGQVVVVAGDLDGDSTGDLLVSAPGFRSAGTRVGAVYAYSGASRAFLYRVDGYGSTLSGLGDIDRDGRSDFAVGAPQGDGVVFVFSGATGSLIRDIHEGFLNHFGSSLAGCDVDGDGITDLVVGAPAAVGTGEGFYGAVFVYSGSDGTLLMRVDGTVPYEMLGGTVASAGDTNGDGREDLILCAPSTTIYDTSFTRGAALLYGLAEVLPARAFSGSAGLTVNLGAGRATSLVQVEPIGGAFSNDDVWLGTIVLRRATDPVHEIKPLIAASAGDTDGNGVAEIGTQFSKVGLRDLFGIRTSRADTASVIVEASTRSGGRVRAAALAGLVSSPPVVVTLTPNPMRGRGVLSFITTKIGPLKVKLFDLSGHLVRDLADDPLAQPGYHDVAIDGRGSRGETLASSVYFYRIETADGLGSGRIAIVR